MVERPMLRREADALARSAECLLSQSAPLKPDLPVSPQAEPFPHSELRPAFRQLAGALQ